APGPGERAVALGPVLVRCGLDGLVPQRVRGPLSTFGLKGARGSDEQRTRVAHSVTCRSAVNIAARGRDAGYYCPDIPIRSDRQNKPRPTLPGVSQTRTVSKLRVVSNKSLRYFLQCYRMDMPCFHSLPSNVESSAPLPQSKHLHASRW